jgi:hypothetical protein
VVVRCERSLEDELGGRIDHDSEERTTSWTGRYVYRRSERASEREKVNVGYGEEHFMTRSARKRRKSHLRNIVQIICWTVNKHYVVN